MELKEKKELLVSFLNFVRNDDFISLSPSEVSDKYIELTLLPEALQTVKKHNNWLIGGVGEVVSTKALIEANEVIVNYVENLLKDA
jgi:hypothetical protein